MFIQTEKGDFLSLEDFIRRADPVELVGSVVGTSNPYEFVWKQLQEKLLQGDAVAV